MTHSHTPTDRTVNQQIESLRALALCQRKADDSQLLCEAADTLELLRDVVVGARVVPYTLLEMDQPLEPPPPFAPVHDPEVPCGDFRLARGAGPGSAAICAACGHPRRKHAR